MTERPDFRELVGDDLSPEERARLERVHELLVAAGPPPELPPALVQPDVDEREETAVSFLPRRRAGFGLAIAAAIGLTAFLIGFVVGRAKEPFHDTFQVAMHGTARDASATATIHVGKLDEGGNWPLKVDVHGLGALPKGQYYEMFLTRNGKRAASCGTFRVSRSSSTDVRLNAPYNMRSFNGWVVTLERPGSNTHPVMLTT